MIEQLFGSKTRVKLLQLFYKNPNRSFYVREITRKIDEQINSVRRELANLLSVGIISSETTNNRLYYEVDQKYEYYQPLSQIFGGAETTATKSKKTAKTVADTEADDEYKVLGNVELVIYTGQFTRDDRSGVDLLIVGDINQTQLVKFMAALEKKENKELRYVVMPTDEFHYRRQINDRFISDVITAKHQVVIDKQGALTSATK
ncbi:MAG TPA: transcriptional regulator [Candidatus Saccharibacteria bacterium]|nr:transcriptional regulator [Candidatus Saccharibacteria bacterium]